MSSTLVKINKNTFDIIDTINLGMSCNAMIIHNQLDSINSTDLTIPFSISVSRSQVPSLKEVKFCLSTRSKVDLTANNVNNIIITNEDKDVGNINYHDTQPYTPRNEPYGFIELKGE